MAVESELQSARQGLRDAAEIMVRFEISQGDDRSAQLQLQQLDGAHPDLQASIDGIRERRLADRARLERIESDNDPRTAWWARMLVFSAIGTVWALTPIGTAVIGMPQGYLRELSISGVTFFGTGVLMALLAPWLVKSRLNRAMVVLIAAGPGLAMLLNIGGWLRGIPSELSGTFELFVYFHCALIATLLADWRLFVGTLGFAAAYFLSMWWPGTTLMWMNIANVVLVLNALAIWLPEGLRSVEPEDKLLF